MPPGAFGFLTTRGPSTNTLEKSPSPSMSQATKYFPIDGPASDPDLPWYAVRCLFSHPNRAPEGVKFLYEERMTLWRTASWGEAFKLAEAEAKTYAADCGCEFIDATDAFLLSEKTVGVGTEVWSLMRESGMYAEMYRQTFCATPRDRSGDHCEEE